MKWDVSLEGKQRKLHFVNKLWTDPYDSRHVQESAEIVAKLVGFCESELQVSKVVYKRSCNFDQNMGDDSQARDKGLEMKKDIRCPMLTSTNYTVWSMRMKVMLRLYEVWDTIDPGSDDAKKNNMAIALIFQSVPEALILQIGEHDTSKKIWEAIKSRNLGADRVREARLQTLMSEFDKLKMSDTDTVDDYAGKLSGLASRAAALGEIMEASKLAFEERIKEETQDEGQSKLMFGKNDMQENGVTRHLNASYTLSTNVDEEPGSFKLSHIDVTEEGDGDEHQDHQHQQVAENNDVNQDQHVTSRYGHNIRKPKRFDDYILLAEVEGGRPLLDIDGEPESYIKAAVIQAWINAMKAEIESIIKNKTRKLVKKPTGVKSIGLKWIYKIKRNADETVIKYKARLVAKGYVQQQGIDFDEVFAQLL
ncbi:uncharacterized protein LOC125586079 [Brassica napus]|uniref:uncharacterized protein LOC125586079 n=1 Tax=Brassica napus TaxID=3708 RepID=UPI00207967BD|nr:uncharacterized protein LOC125586079 [Brassica napus]